MKIQHALVALAVLTAPGFALADGDACTVDNVAGNYGFNFSGTWLSPNAAGLPPGPTAGAGVLTFDRTGHFHGVETISFNGSIANGVTFDGTYVVNPDCTLTLEDPGFFHNFGVIVAGGDEIFLISTDNGVLLNITVKRLHGR